MENTFATIFSYLQKLPTPVEGFITTGGVPFTVEARITRNGEQAILSRSGKKSLIYIYPDDWGNALNRNRTRIAHYAVPIDEWYSHI
jgi:short subunit fatty acids transporter